MKKTILLILAVAALFAMVGCDVETVRGIGEFGYSLSSNIFGYTRSQDEEKEAATNEAAKIAEVLSTSSSDLLPKEASEIQALVDNILSVDELDLSSQTIHSMTDADGNPLYNTTELDFIKKTIDSALGTTSTNGTIINVLDQAVQKVSDIEATFPDVKDAADKISQKINEIASKNAAQLTLEDVVVVSVANVMRQQFSELVEASAEDILAKSGEFSQYIDVFETLGIIDHLNWNSIIERAVSEVEA